jgi:hypothetical protein
MAVISNARHSSPSHSATFEAAKLAVKRRMLRAATWLTLWAGHLLSELEKQNVELYERHGGLPGEGRPDHDLITISFERRDMEELICGMRKWDHRFPGFTDLGCDRRVPQA